MSEILNIDTFADFHDLVAARRDFCASGHPLVDFVFRGQANSDWPLETTFSRLLHRAGYRPKLRENSFENRAMHMENFKHFLLGRRGANPAALSVESAWALGQHYGLATPLLDWTTSPYIALFFAYSGADSNGPKRSVWCLNREATTNFDRDLLKHKILKLNEYEKYNVRYYDGTERDKRRIDRILGAVLKGGHINFLVPENDENSRIISQSGVLSMLPNEKSIDSWADRLHPESLIKVDLPNTLEFRDKILTQLNLMNINYATLFPDIGGVALHSNFLAEFKFGQ